MHLRFSPAEEAFRAEARAWLEANLPRAPRPTELAARAAYDQAWQRRMYDSGWAGIAWPRAHGGRGATLMEQLVWCEEYARAGAPDISTLFVGLNHAGPTLVACGTEEQKAAHLPPILRGEVIWCQGFSEPNAGSDLASLQTRAVVEGDVLVVSGQKVWTSFAHVAQLQELLVRTEVDALRAMTYRSVSLAARTGVPGAEASMIRLFFSELLQRIDLLAMDMQGAPAVDGPVSRWTELYLAGLSQTIGGGTKDIQRNIIGERVLGLPR